MAYKIDKEKCAKCGACRAVCPVGAARRTADGNYEINADSCIECGACVNVCANDAISE